MSPWWFTLMPQPDSAAFQYIDVKFVAPPAAWSTESETSSTRNDVMSEKSVTATNRRRTVCPLNADTSNAGLCTQPFVAFKLL